MIRALELLGALTVLVLAWIGIAEVFPQYDYVETEKEEEKELCLIYSPVSETHCCLEKGHKEGCHGDLEFEKQMYSSN